MYDIRSLLDQKNISPNFSISLESQVKGLLYGCLRNRSANQHKRCSLFAVNACLVLSPSVLAGV